MKLVDALNEAGYGTRIEDNGKHWTLETEYYVIIYEDEAMKYNIGDILADDEGNSGIVCIKWDDGDICTFENDAAHPNPIIVIDAV